MTEQQYIEREQARQDAKLLRQLRKVHRTGSVGPRAALETLLIADYIILTGPTPYRKYNHYRLTEKGMAEKVRLEYGR